jgi:uncharacterized DUF497 family protein
LPSADWRFPAADFKFETALIWTDMRKDYGEAGMIALGLIGRRLHALGYVETAGGFRVISLRKVNKRKRDRYAQNT